jgi:hypothetical protein
VIVRCRWGDGDYESSGVLRQILNGPLLGQGSSSPKRLVFSDFVEPLLSELLIDCFSLLGLAAIGARQRLGLRRRATEETIEHGADSHSPRSVRPCGAKNSARASLGAHKLAIAPRNADAQQLKGLAGRLIRLFALMELLPSEYPDFKSASLPLQLDFGLSFEPTQHLE